MKTTKDLKVGDKAILKSYSGTFEVKVKKVGTRYLYVTRTQSRFVRETGACPDARTVKVFTVEQHAENLQTAGRFLALRNWGVELRQPFDAAKIRKVYEALLPVIGEDRPISNAG